MISYSQRMNRQIAFLIHLLTASGAACALMALVAAADARWDDMFWWLLAAQFVDGIDGPLARKYRVSELLPNWSGHNLDFVIDYATYVFIPAFALAQADLLPSPLGLIAACIVTISGGLYFADDRMKTQSNAFRGFPAVWNGVLFYYFLLLPSPWIGLPIIVLLAIAQFLPIEFVHPVRVKTWRPFTLTVMLIWAGFAFRVTINDMNSTMLDQVVLGVTGIYFFVIGPFLHYRRVWWGVKD